MFLALSQLETWWRRNCGGLFSRLGVDFTGAGAGSSMSREGGLLSRAEFHGLCRAFAATVFEKIAGMKAGARVVVGQTPEEVRVSELLLGAFPEAYFLHVIRDPRSVFASQRSAARSWAIEFPRNRVERARLWSADVAAGRRLAEMTGRYRELRYEALLSDTAAELKRVFEWFELTADAALCQKAVAACSLDNLKQNQRAPAGFFRKGSATGWREELSRAELKLVEYFSRDLMEQLGYEPALPTSPRPPLEVRLHETRERLLPPLRRLSRRITRTWGAQA